MTITKEMIEKHAKELENEYYGFYSEELAELDLMDLKRKGCINLSGNCDTCQLNYLICPMSDWEKRHPEYAKDELAMRIRNFKLGENN
jgi:hypothetical protein